ncbi:MAG: type II secretion system protein [Patescibacteria group bacterium]
MKRLGAKLAFLFRDQRGFTMLEMVTVLAIVGVLSALVIVNTAVGDRRQELRDAASQFITHVRNVEARAAASEAIPDEEGNPVSRKAYGICASSTVSDEPCALPPSGTRADEYELYARQTDDTDYASRPTNPDILQTVMLPEDVAFSVSGGHLDFLPPQPSMLVVGSSADRAIGFQYQDVSNCGGSPDCVTIRFRPRAGVVYVE